eukprot:10598081-Ditylum_brightwellii.AAC.1
MLDPPMKNIDFEANEDKVHDSNGEFVIDKDKPRDLASNSIPPCFNMVNLTPPPPYPTYHFDETHKKVVTGCPRRKVTTFK